MKTLALGLGFVLVLFVGTVRAVNIAPLGTAGNDGYNNVWGDPTNRINDGVHAWDPANGFHSDGNDDTTRLWVTWTDNYVIDSVELWHCEAGAIYIASDYQIQILNAGGNPIVDNDWTTVFNVTGNTNVNPSYSFAPVTTAGVRLFVTNDGPNAPLRFEELLVFGELPPPAPEPSTFLLLGLGALGLVGRSRRRPGERASVGVKPEGKR